MEPDPKKIQGITEMPLLTNIQQLQAFLDKINFMNTYVLHLASHHTSTGAIIMKQNIVDGW